MSLFVKYCAHILQSTICSPVACYVVTARNIHCSKFSHSHQLESFYLFFLLAKSMCVRVRIGTHTHFHEPVIESHRKFQFRYTYLVANDFRNCSKMVWKRKKNFFFKTTHGKNFDEDYKISSVNRLIVPHTRK